MLKTMCRKLLALICLVLLPVLVNADIRAADYLLASGDVIRVQVYQNQDLSLERRLSEAGTVSYPLIGTVKLKGLSISSAEQLIARALQDGNYVNKPQVTITLLENKGNLVSVLGLVKQPGRYPLDGGNTRVSEILALAGGVSEQGSDSIVVTGVRDGKSFRKIVDIAGLYLEDKPGEDIFVSAGDTIYVHRAPVFYIYGEVQKPGSYRVERRMSVMQALAQAGGLTSRGTERGLKLQRRGSDGKPKEVAPQMTDLIEADDVIYVRESIL